jgi:hypothetical protein
MNKAILLVKPKAKRLSSVDLSMTMSWVLKHKQMAAPQSDRLSDVSVMTDGTYFILIRWQFRFGIIYECDGGEASNQERW